MVRLEAPCVSYRKVEYFCLILKATEINQLEDTKYTFASGN